MTGGVALGVVAVPTLAGLALRGLADPKRRRAAREAAAPQRWSRVAQGLLAAAALFVALTAGPVALLIWSAAATLLGWGLSEGLAAGSHALRLRGDAMVERVFRTDLGRRLSPDGAAPLRRVPAMARDAVLRRLASSRERGIAIAIICGLVAAGAALSARTLAEQAVGTAGRLVSLQALTLFDGLQAARDRVRPCLRVLDALPDTTVLRDLLSDRATTIPIADGAEDAGTDLQHCILSHGGEGASVERDAGTTRFSLAPEVVGAIHADVVEQLLGFETMAELVQATPAARELICRHVFAVQAEDTLGLVAALRHDRTYAKTGDLLARLAALDRAAGAPRSLCPA